MDASRRWARSTSSTTTSIPNWGSTAGWSAAGRCAGSSPTTRSARACTEPPERTRAYFRGRCVARFSGALVAANWDSMVFDTGGETLKRVPMMEPLRGGKDKVEAILDRAEDAAALLEALGG